MVPPKLLRWSRKQVRRIRHSEWQTTKPKTIEQGHVYARFASLFGPGVWLVSWGEGGAARPSVTYGVSLSTTRTTKSESESGGRGVQLVRGSRIGHRRS